MNFASIKVLFRAPDSLALWGIPYAMKVDVGQQPYDLWRARRDYVPPKYGSSGPKQVDLSDWILLDEQDPTVAAFLATQCVPQGPCEWSKIAEAPVSLPPPLATFTSEGGRTFTVEAGEHVEHFKGDTFWHDTFPLHYEGELAGSLWCSETYGRTAAGLPRWSASTRAIYWAKASDAPTGIGFDVSGFDTAEEAVAAWGRSVDQILDWAEGKPVPSIYAGWKCNEKKRGPIPGTFQKAPK